jgi:hypothetical protein
LRKLVAGAFGVALVLAIATLIAGGAGTSGTITALRVTARWCFVLFWLAYAGGALAVLFGPAFDALARRGRAFGLAFAASFLVHLALVVWLYWISARPPVSQKTLVIFGIGAFWVWLLVALSFGRVSGRIGPMATRFLRVAGMNYIALAFLFDFARNPLRGDFATFMAYAPFLALGVAGPGLRILAGLKEQTRKEAVLF